MDPYLDAPHQVQDAPMSSAQKRKRRKMSKVNEIVNEDSSAKGYVENPMRSDTSRQARKKRADIRELSSRLGPTIPDAAQKRPAGDQLSHHATAVAVVVGTVLKSKGIVQRSNVNDERASEAAKVVFGPEDPQI